jgi:hypothetical protein
MSIADIAGIVDSKDLIVIIDIVVIRENAYGTCTNSNVSGSGSYWPVQSGHSLR